MSCSQAILTSLQLGHRGRTAKSRVEVAPHLIVKCKDSQRYMCSHSLWMNWMVVVSNRPFCNSLAHPDDPDHLQNKTILHNPASKRLFCLDAQDYWRNMIVVPNHLLCIWMMRIICKTICLRQSCQQEDFKTGCSVWLTKNYCSTRPSTLQQADPSEWSRIFAKILLYQILHCPIRVKSGLLNLICN